MSSRSGRASSLEEALNEGPKRVSLNPVCKEGLPDSQIDANINGNMLAFTVVFANASVEVLPAWRLRTSATYMGTCS